MTCKQRLADDIVALFPPHDSYVEVFGGGCSVLVTKPAAAFEVYNDLDEGLVTFFRCLREQPERLVPLLELTPYARREWQHCRETLAGPVTRRGGARSPLVRRRQPELRWHGHARA